MPGELHPWEREVCSDVERSAGPVRKVLDQEGAAGGCVCVWAYPVFEEKWKRVIVRTEFGG